MTEIKDKIMGVLIGLLMIIGDMVSGLVESLRDPAGVLYALLAPFSGSFRRLYDERRDGRFYDTLTRENLQSTRASLLDEHDGEDALGAEIREAASGKQNTLRCIFEDFSVIRDEDGCQVWNETQFTAFVASRLGDAGTAPALWRNFCYDSSNLFTRVPFPFQSQKRSDFDFNDWIWTVSQVTQRNIACNRDVEQNNTNWTLYENEKRKSTAWSTFSRLALPAGHDEKSGDGVWVPPSLLDEVTGIAYSRLRAKLWPERPRLSTVRANVLKRNLVDDDASQQLSTNAFALPYHDLLSILCATLQVRKQSEPPRKNAFFSTGYIDLDNDRKAQLSLAKGILAVGGIHGISSVSSVSFEDYAAFSEKFLDGRAREWSFELELTGLWRALFSALPRPGSCDKKLPTLVSQAFEFVYPFREDEDDYDNLKNAKSVYASDISDVSMDGVVQALNSESSGKLVLIYGTTAAIQKVAQRTRGRISQENPASSEATILAIMTSSPLCTTDDYDTDCDYLVDDRHLLFELAPRPRLLAWSTAEEKSKPVTYTEHVNTTSGKATISFGQNAACSSGLTLNIDTGMATLRSTTESAEGKEPGYSEIRIGPCPEDSDRQLKQEPWETAVRVHRVEVYSCTGGVYPHLAVERK